MNGGHRGGEKADPNSELGSPTRKKGEGEWTGLVGQWKLGEDRGLGVAGIGSLPWKGEGLSSGEGTEYEVHRIGMSREERNSGESERFLDQILRSVCGKHRQAVGCQHKRGVSDWCIGQEWREGEVVILSLLKW